MSDEQKASDSILIAWMLVNFAWTVLVVGTTTYLVFWKDHSGWWYLLALALIQSDVYKAVKLRLEIPENKDE